MIFSELYANCYDEIHASKTYSDESSQIIQLIQSEFPDRQISKILDFGCGTGIHLATLVTKNYDLYGYDRNQFMLDVAKRNFPTSHFTQDYSAVPNDMDLVYSIFDVVSYQISTGELEKFFDQIASKIKRNGLIVIDGWYFPGLQIHPPEVSERSFEFNGKRICRKVEPSSVDYFRTTTLQISLIDVETEEVLAVENHVLKAFGQEELTQIARARGFRNIHFRDGKVWTNMVQASSWRFMMFAEFSGESESS